MRLLSLIIFFAICLIIRAANKKSQINRKNGELINLRASLRSREHNGAKIKRRKKKGIKTVKRKKSKNRGKRRKSSPNNSRKKKTKKRLKSKQVTISDISLRNCVTSLIKMNYNLVREVQRKAGRVEDIYKIIMRKSNKVRRNFLYKLRC